MPAQLRSRFLDLLRLFDKFDRQRLQGEHLIGDLHQETLALLLLHRRRLFARVCQADLLVEGGDLPADQRVAEPHLVGSFAESNGRGGDSTHAIAFTAEGLRVTNHAQRVSARAQPD
ncbi:MAG TPA: hypothetical protein VEL76_13615 [Gemmataceae bacterium]|nr:hypothetical protein [Gemmataceae bacterium]